jgi:hypothetical protein
MLPTRDRVFGSDRYEASLSICRHMSLARKRTTASQFWREPGPDKNGDWIIVSYCRYWCSVGVLGAGVSISVLPRESWDLVCFGS